MFVFFRAINVFKAKSKSIRLTAGEHGEQLELPQQMAHRGRLTTRNHQSVNGFQFQEPTDRHSLGAGLTQCGQMLAGVTLKGEHPHTDRHVAGGVKSRW